MVARHLLLPFVLAAAAAAPVRLPATEEPVGRPQMRYFGAPELHSKGPVRAFAETPDGCLWVGSNHLVVFNGFRFEPIDVPGAYAFQALASASPAGGPAPVTQTGPRVWVGAVGAFGYVEADRFGRWNFVSLAPQVRAAGLEVPSQIGAVFALGGGAVFVTTHRVLRWDGAKFEGWTLRSAESLKAAADEGGSVWLHESGVGLLRLGATGAPVLVRSEAALPAGPVEWLLAPPEAAGAPAAVRGEPSGEGVLVGTDSGVYRLTANGAERLPGLSDLVRDQSPVGAVLVESDQIAVMTAGHGVLLGGLHGGETIALNRAHGLNDEAPYSVWGDRRGAVWIGLDDGCVRVDSAETVSIFDSREGLEQGLPRRVLSWQGATYVVTDRAVYRVEALPGGVGHLRPVAPTASLRDVLAHEAAPWLGEEEGPPRPTAHSRLLRIGPRIFAFTDTQILADEPGRGFVPLPELAGWVGVAAATSPAAATDYWIAQCAGSLGEGAPFALLRVSVDDRGGFHWEPLRVGGLDFIDEVTSLDLTADPADPAGAAVWIGGKGGLLRARLDGLRVSSNPRPLQLRSVRISGGGGAFLEVAPRVRPSLRPGFGSVAFGYSGAQPMEIAPLAVYYQTRLAGAEPEWSRPEHLNEREFTALAPGRYTFMARRIDRYGRAGDAVSYPFVVAPPWYGRWPALAAAAALLAAAGWVILRWRLRRLRRQRDRLDRLVAQRTRELELSNTAKSEFLENISHEIRNPLNGIVGLVNLLKPERLSAEDRGVARSLKASAEHLRRVAAEVLDFSKLEYGFMTVASRPFNLGRTLGEVVEVHAETARHKGSTISLQVAGGGGDRFLGDEPKLRTIVGNFIGNALKYAAGTPIEVRADWTEDGDGTVQVFIAVSDRGPGLPPEEQELVFQKFVRGSGAKASGAVGSGFGLAICRTLARRMGGNVGVESPLAGGRAGQPGAGASFHVWLPLRRAVAAAPATRPPTAAGETALIVDDEDYNRTVLAGLARELGYEPIVAESAALGEERAGQPGIAVVFLDLELPDGRGEDLARRLRARAGGARWIVVATTGQDSDEARQRCAKAGMDGFLLKPFDLETVRRVLAQAAVRRTRAARRRVFQLHAEGAAATPDLDPAGTLLGAVEADLTAIRAGVAADDRAAIRAAAHRLRSLAALVWARELQAAAVELEQRAPELTAAELAELTATAAAAVDRLRVELKELVTAGPEPEPATADSW
jgi:signal transduction histidine kinase/CheY-like chemotaxis protein/HPt (histidine-containing phosphotransfer) domain-containing protein